MINFLHHLFFPREDNNYRSEFLHHKAILALILLLVSAGLFTSIIKTNFPSVLGVASNISNQELLILTNQQRQSNNLNALTDNSELDQAAANKAADMFNKDYWAHNAPDGTTPWVFIKSAGYNYIYAGENLARGFNSAPDVITAWMNSPEHRANILQAGFRDQGMGVSFGDVQQSQYYSAKANTFGALAPAPKSAAAKASPPAVTVAPTKKLPAPTPVAQKPATSTPLLNVTPVKIVQEPATQTPPSTIVQPIEIRGVVPENSSPASNVILTPEPQSSTTPSSTAASASPVVPGQSASAVIGNDKTTVLTDYDVNRYLILICGVALLMLMLSDIRIALQKKLGGLDKKFNNLAILVISLVVIAFMYWL